MELIAVNSKYKKIILFLMGATIICCCLLLYSSVYAQNVYYSLSGETYEKDGEDAFDSSVAKYSNFSYGRSTLGSMTIAGAINEKGKYGGYDAYGVNDAVAFSYSYDGSYHTDNKEEWNLEVSGAKNVKGIELEKKVQTGAVIVQKSTDGKVWVEATKIKNDCFKKANLNDSVVYTTTTEEIMQGTYYRITVAYQMKKRTGVVKKWGPIPDDETYSHKSYVEQYTFFVCTDKNYVSVEDLETKSVINTNSTVEKGFTICKNNSYDMVNVIRDSEASKLAADFDSFTTPGNYTVVVTTKLGKEYKYSITVSEGLSNTSLSPAVFECKKNAGFVDGVKTTEKTAFGIDSLTSLGISQNAGFVTTKSTFNGFDAYGINGDAVSIFLRLNYKAEDGNRDWKVVEDTWGKKEKEKVEDSYIGAVGKGAIVIQTSVDGKSWIDADKSRYSKGLYTTDFAKYYSSQEDVLIYTPKGMDVLSGVYIRVKFAYQVTYGKNTEDCLEKYEFYLCSNELSAVTFPNLTISNIDTYVNEDKDTAEIYKAAETLTDNAGTVTGFSINIDNNPTVKYKVKKDGKEITVPAKKEFTDTGKYEVTLISAVGDNEKVIIYVDSSDSKQAMETYFGTGFIQGKRIYDEGAYPVYEAGRGVTSYNLEKVADSYLPIYGVLRNETTGKEVTFDSSRNARSGDILEAGEYTATFKTGVSSNGAKSGDVREFTFHFSVIANGTAPGPVVNQGSLAKYARSNISDSYPIYYGVTYPSAKVGYITLAFAEEKDAIKFAYAYEKGMVEIQADGTYRYNASTADGQKASFESLFDLTEATNEVSERIVKKYYFNLSDEFTYMTLINDSIKNLNDLRTLKLNRSIIVFADKQKELLIEKATNTTSLPVISAKKYAYIQSGDNGESSYGENDFEFVRDEYGVDSNSVIITDKLGKTYSINYREGVASQLERQNCPSGVVTITEETIYGDSVSYDAIYIRANENTSSTKIKYYTAGDEKSVEISIADTGKQIEADLFTIDQVVDSLDPYSLILVSNGEKEWVYSADQVIKDIWSEAGKYTVSVFNRLGYGYSFAVLVRDSDYSVVSFTGEGTDSQKDLVVQFEQENISLPVLSRYGFEFMGYEDQNGKKYIDKIEKVLFKGVLTLQSSWEPRNVKLRFINADGSEMLSEVVPFDSAYILPSYNVEGNWEFKGWSYAGKTIQGTRIKVDAENEMIFAPVLVNADTGTEIVVAKKTQMHVLIHVLIVAIILIIGAGGYWFIWKSKMIESEKNGEEEDTGETV